MRLPAAIFLGLALAALPAAGDWLVTSDGTRIETEGSWQVKGSQVIFTLPGGKLSALRAADVDLEASAAATRAAAAAPAAAPAEDAAPAAAAPRKSVRVFTNESIGPSGATEEEGAEAEAAGEEDDGTEAQTPAAGEPVEVASWSTRESDEGMEIVGTLRNTGEAIAASVRLTVTVPGAEEGDPPLELLAFLGATAVAPGGTTSFRALLPGIFFLEEDPSFEVSSDGFSVQGPAPTEPAEGAMEELDSEPPP